MCVDCWGLATYIETIFVGPPKIVVQNKIGCNTPYVKSQIPTSNYIDIIGVIIYFANTVFTKEGD